MGEKPKNRTTDINTPTPKREDEKSTEKEKKKGEDGQNRKESAQEKGTAFKRLEIGKGIEIADKLSLGISVVVAILIGIGVGIWMKNFFNQPALLWVGVAWGVGAAGLNIKRAYDKLKKELEQLAEEYKSYPLVSERKKIGKEREGKEEKEE